MTTIVDGTLGVTFPAGGVGNPAGAVVGTTDTQTLTNKTLTGAVMNGTVGATTPAAGAFTTLSATGITTVAAGSAALPAIVSTTGTADTGLWFPAADTVAASTAGTERMRIDSSGNVGIGTSSPSTFGKFVTQTSTSGNTPIIAITDNSASPQLNHYITDSGSTVRNLNQIGFNAGSTSSANYQGFMTFSTMASAGGTISERMRIDASGNVGIGTTSPANKLDLQSPSATALCFHGLQSSVVEWQIGFKASDSNFYVGTGGTLGGAGLYQTNTGTAWIAVSDERLKKDITPLDDAKGLAGLLKLNPSTFYWKSEDAQQDLQIGLIAQNVQEHFPDLVSMGPVSEAAPDGAIGVNYTGFIAPLIKAIQELKAIIDTQATRIAALEAK
jgi:hypothetical protein